jgi:hypothetical protein
MAWTAVMTIRTRVYGIDRLRLAWWALTGRKFSLTCRADEIYVNGTRLPTNGGAGAV